MKNIRDHIQKKVIEEIFLKPAYALIPLAMGLTMMIGMWAINLKSLICFLFSLGLSAVSVGVYATWVAIAYGDKEGLEQKVLTNINDAVKQKKQKDLEVLRKQLLKDKDPRTEVLLDNLVELTDLIREQSSSIDSEVADGLEILSQIDELFKACIEHLRQTYLLYNQSVKVTVRSVKDSFLDRREKLILEVTKNVESLGKILITFNEIGSGKTNGVDNLRRQLEIQLDVAKRVDEEIGSWENPRDQEEYLRAAEEARH